MSASALIAVDGTDASIAAVRAARRLLGDDARLTLLHVAEIVPITPPMTPGIAPVGTGTAMHPDPAETVRSASDIAHRSAVEAGAGDAEAIGAVGDPVETIVDVANARHVDVVVVGTHEHDWLTKLLTRSVGEGVRERADVPVLVVPSPKALRDDEPLPSH